MTVEEILDAIAFKYPHSYANGDIIKIINRVQKELFRTLFKPETATQFDLIAENPFYTIDIPLQRIIEVVVDGEEYPQVNIRDKSLRRFYYKTEENAIGIYPTPTEDVDGGLVVFHFMDPKVLTESDLGVEPEFDSAWHMMIVYRVCVELAEAARDTDMITGFITQVNGLESEYYRDFTFEPSQIQMGR